MYVSIVLDKKEKKQFIEVAKIIYKDDPTWVCPLDDEMDGIFDPKRNVYYSHGICERWILKDDVGKLIGRIAAFIDYKTSDVEDQPTGGIGFFECINNQEAADLLFDTAKAWLKKEKVVAMDGPINWGERDSYWGLLVDGFTHPSYEVAYNHKYYQKLFENYGFQTYFKQEGFHFDVKKPLSERFLKISKWITSKPGYEFRHFTWKDQEKFTVDFAEAFNAAWNSFKDNFEPLTAEYIRNTLKKAKVFIDEEFIWIAYKDDRPIAILLMYPDINQVLKHLNGKLNLWNKLKFIYLVKRKAITRVRTVLMGVIPEYQNRGIESGFIINVMNVFKKKPHYTEAELSWVGDFNPKMRKLFVSVGSMPAKHYITYRYLFDREAEFKRYPIQT